jgi:Ran GTPase-activating protein (RanGAP) involved in mRNA processing and transport
MGAKKKAEGGGGGKKDAVDDSVEKVYRAYRRNLAELGLSMPRKLEEKFMEIRDEKNPGTLSDLVVWDEIGPLGVRAIADALKDVQYNQLRNIRFWKANTEDDGVRSLCTYLQQQPTVSALEFVECNLTPLSCEFLGKVLSPSVPSAISILKLDHNNLGNQGMKNLAKGICTNINLKFLSLAFCGLDGKEGGRALLEIIIFQYSTLEDLDLQGNLLRGEGVLQVFHAMQINKSILKLNLSDNQFGEEKSVIEALLDMMRMNETLTTLDLRYNGFYDTGVDAICEGLRNEVERRNTTLGNLLLSQNKISEEKMDELIKTISSGKGKGKRGKKGKKGKK